MTGAVIRPVVNFRAPPDMGRWRRPTVTPTYAVRLHDRGAVNLVSAAVRGVVPETFAMAAYLNVAGRSIIHPGIVVPDDIDAMPLAAIEKWGGAHPIATTAGPRPWRVSRLSDYFDPMATVERQPWAFQPRAYSGAGFVIGPDLGRVFGLAAEGIVERSGRNRGAWECWLSGWGRQHERNRWKRRSPNRPPLWMKARRVGWQLEFAPCQKGFGKYVDGRPWRGAFIDIMSLAYALDGDRGAPFGEHRANFGLAPTELPLAVAVDAEGAVRMAEAVLAVHELVVVLDGGLNR